MEKCPKCGAQLIDGKCPTCTENIVRKIKIGRQYRDFPIERAQVDEKNRTVELSFSSETRDVERWWGIEILDHDKSSVDLKRLKVGGSLLVDHDRTKLVGVIEKVWIDEASRKGRAIVRFGKRGLADDIFSDVLDGIRSNVSCSYDVSDLILEEERKDKPSIFRAKRWAPYEISIVSIPADTTVGVGRSNDPEAKEIEIKIPVKEVRTKMEKCDKCDAELTNGKCSACEAKKATDAKRALEIKDPLAVTPNALEMEKNRKRAIENLCKANKLDDKYKDMWIGQGVSLEAVSEDILRILEERGKTNPQPLSRIDLTQQETRQFSLARAILACKDNNWEKAAFELECSRAVAQKLNKVPEPTKFYVPFEVLQRPIDRQGRRDISIGASGGSYLVSTENIGFIELLRNRSVCMRMGARRLSGLIGNVTVPRMSAAATAYWLANETATITESQQTILQMGLSPHSVGAYTEISRQLLLQSSPGAEGIVSDDLAQVVAVAADLAALTGSGAAGQPHGIVGTAGVGSVAGAALAYAGALEFQTDVATSNVVPIRGGYVTTPAGAAICMAEMKVTNAYSPLWEGNIWEGNMCGFPAMSSNQMAAATMLFGDWQELVIGEWGVLEVEINPYANFAAGIIGVRALYSLDVGIRRPFAFSYASGLT